MVLTIAAELLTPRPFHGSGIFFCQFLKIERTRKLLIARRLPRLRPLDRSSSSQRTPPRTHSKIFVTEWCDVVVYTRCACNTYKRGRTLFFLRSVPHPITAECSDETKHNLGRPKDARATPRQAGVLPCYEKLLSHWEGARYLSAPENVTFEITLFEQPEQDLYTLRT